MSKLNDEEGGKMICDYLCEQNRPYSAADVFSNLRGVIGKTQVVKVLEQLIQEEEGKIREKIYGKQKIYFADQRQFQTFDDGELKNMDGKIAKLSDELSTLKESVSGQNSSLNRMNSALTLEQAKSRLADAEKQSSLMKIQLDEIKSRSETLSPSKNNKVRDDHKKLVDLWKKRKRVAMDMFNAILEGFPDGKVKLMEEIGFETDEDCSVQLPASA